MWTKKTDKKIKMEFKIKFIFYRKIEKKNENLYFIGSNFEIEFKSLSHPIQITKVKIEIDNQLAP